MAIRAGVWIDDLALIARSLLPRMAVLGPVTVVRLSF